MSILIVNIFLAMIWSALVGDFALRNLVTGFLVGYLTLFLIRRTLPPTNYFYKFNQIVRFLAYFLWEVLLANLRVARDVLRPGPLRLQPRVIAVPLEDTRDVPIIVLASAIALTPGSLALDVSKKDRVMFIHTIHAPDADEARRQIKQGFERLVVDLFRENPKPENAQEELEQ